MIKIDKQLKELIENNAVALATVGVDRKPHCIAVGDVKVVDGSKLLVGDIFLKETLMNIKKDNNVALAVWDRDWEDECIGYELRGETEYFTSGKWLDKVKEIHTGFKPKGAILVTINKIKKLA